MAMMFLLFIILYLHHVISGGPASDGDIVPPTDTFENLGCPLYEFTVFAVFLDLEKEVSSIFSIKKAI